MLGCALFGASQLAFLCDDAYIHFRYAANAHAGHGLVWNAPPFQPVEGMGFLWAVILWALWSWFGIEPPDAANPFSFGCGAMQFLVLALAARRVCYRDGTRMPAVVGLCAMAAIASNRTFLQWMSGGLDTALFNLMLLAWVLHAFRARAARHGGWLLLWSTLATLAALTRPDGLPLVCATAGIAALLVQQRQLRWRPALLGLSPLLGVVAQVLWRRSFYGEWLPNTYYAKVVAAWPEAGLRYFACFALENGAWLWLPIACLWALVACLRDCRAAWRALWDNLPAAAAVAIVLFNATYYVVKVGGDHFEYRVLSQLVPLGVLASAAIAARVSNGVRLPIAAVTAIALASCAGWVHLALTHDMPKHGFQPIAPRLPAIVRPVAHWFDQQQAWLLFRNIGLRCIHHAILLRRFSEPFPQRIHIQDPPDPFPMLAIGAVGMPSWSLPNCAILDLHGLNDWVTARTPIGVATSPFTREQLRPFVTAADADHDGYLVADELRAAIALFNGGQGDPTAGDYVVSVFMTIHANERLDALSLEEAAGIADTLNTARSMAHERHPPAGYVEAFEPNVTVHQGIATVLPRKVPMTAERVRAIEAEWRAKVERDYLGR